MLLCLFCMCLRPIYCSVSNVASVSVLPILDCLFRFPDALHDRRKCLLLDKRCKESI